MDAGEEAAGAGATPSRRRQLTIAGGGAAAALVLGLLVWFLFLRGDAKRAPGRGPDAGASRPLAASTRGAADLAPADPLALFPRDLDLIARFDVAQLGAIEGLPAFGKASAPEELRLLLAEMDVDAARDVRTAWLGARGAAPALEAAGGERQGDGPRDVLLVLEGSFDPGKILQVLRDRGLAERANEPFGRIEAVKVRDLTDAPLGYLAFLSETMALLGSEALFQSAGDALTSPSPGVRANKELLGDSGDLSAGALAWLRIRFPEGSLGGAEAPKVRAGGLRAERSEDGKGLRLTLAATFADEVERGKAQLMVTGALPLLAARLSAPEIAQAVQSIRFTPRGSELEASVTLSGALLESAGQEMQAPLSALFSGPAGGEELGGLEGAAGATLDDAPDDADEAAEPDTQDPSEDPSADDNGDDSDSDGDDDASSLEEELEELPGGADG